MMRHAKIHCFLFWLCILFSHELSAQLENCDYLAPPFSVNGVEVNHILGENTDKIFDGSPYPFCLNTGQFVSNLTEVIYLGVWVPPDGPFWNPFIYQLSFSKPVLSLNFLLIGGGLGGMDIDFGAENFVFYTENCELELSTEFACNSLILGDTLYLGVIIDNFADGSGIFSITFEYPIQSFSISGKGGGSGSGFFICSNSIQVAPLWASITAPEQVCTQDSILFTAYEGEPNTHPPPYTFSYTLNGVAQTVTTTGINDSVWVLTPTASGTYTYELLSVTDANGNSVNISCNNTRMVVVEQPPVAQFTASPTSGFAPLEVNLQNQSSNATSYAWFVNEIGGFDSAQPPFSLTEAPTLNLEATGVYEITLVAFNDLGCSDTTVQTVYVLEQLQVVIPNVFTPNNDGVNDWFGITSNVEAYASIVILNRWGNVVFEKEFVTTPNVFEPLWDGTSVGSVTTPGSGIAADGVYFYRVKVGEEEFSGFVHLRR